MRFPRPQFPKYIGPGAFRLFLALVVVFHHSTPLRLGGWAVGLFFCLSGFWIAEMWSSKYQYLDHPYIEFIISRWWRLTPVIFFITFVAAGLMRAGIVDGDTHVLSSPGWWLSQISVAGSAHFGRLLPPTWSLDVEMQYYIVAPLVAILILHLPAASRLALLGVALIWCWLQESRGAAGESPRLDIWLGVFLVGMVASANRWRPTVRLTALCAGAVATAFVVAAALPVTRTWILLKGSTGHILVGYLAATLTVGTIILSAPVAIWTTGLPSSRSDRFLGDLSYPLYLFHWLPREWYYAHLHAGARGTYLLALLATNVAAAIIGALVILVLVDRPSQRLREKWVELHRVKNSPARSANRTGGASLPIVAPAKETAEALIA